MQGQVIQGQVFLFDMDGTLIDSNGVIEDIWHRWAGRHGLDGDLVLSKAHGRQAAETVRLFAPEGIDRNAETAWVNQQAVKETNGIQAMPGAKAFLDQLQASEWAIVTSAKRRIAQQWLSVAGLPQPEILIAAEDVSHSKPDPEGYQLAAKRLGCETSVTIVVEDAEAGLEAGRRAGAQVIGIGSANHLFHLAGAWISSFLQVDLIREPLGGFRLRF